MRRRGRAERSRQRREGCAPISLVVRACFGSGRARSRSTPRTAAASSKPPLVAAKKAVPRRRRRSRPVRPAKVLFGAAKTPAPLAARAIGFYAKGCLAGATALPIDGPAWQAMRLSRNRNWGHPDLVALVEKLAHRGASKHDSWPGLLVGDLSQPRGGPMLTGHASHQVGLDADIWLMPMPDRRLTEKEREDLSATSDAGSRRGFGRPKVWTDAHVRCSSEPPPTPASSGSSCIRPSRRRCARPPPKREPGVAAQDPRLLGPLLSFPCAHRLSRAAARTARPSRRCRTTMAAARS